MTARVGACRDRSKCHSSRPLSTGCILRRQWEGLRTPASVAVFNHDNSWFRSQAPKTSCVLAYCMPCILTCPSRLSRQRRKPHRQLNAAERMQLCGCTALQRTLPGGTRRSAAKWRDIAAAGTQSVRTTRNVLRRYQRRCSGTT